MILLSVDQDLLLLSLFLYFCNIQYCAMGIGLGEKDVPRGHMEKLGAHRAGQGISMIGKFSMPAVFFGHFVRPGKPLWLKSVLQTVDHPGLTKWTDEFFSKNYGDQIVKVELGKKENRNSAPVWLPFNQFLKRYKNDDLYMVHTLSNNMHDLALVPPILQCGGFQRAIHEAVLWLGSGEAKSVLHYDELNNLLCLLDGHKDLILIDKHYKNDVEADGFIKSGGYSTVDVDKVDMKKFPRLANTHWQEVRLDKGDCVFIPQGWYHQVTSSTYRHLALNLWFSQLFWFDSSNCSSDQDLYRPLEPVSTFGYVSPNEMYRYKLLEKLHDKGLLFKHTVVAAIGASTEERRSEFFEAIDRYPDSALSWGELYDFDIDKAVLKFPDIFGLPGNPVGSSKDKVVLYEPPIEWDEDESLNEDENIGEEEADGNVTPDDSVEVQGTVGDIGSDPGATSLPLPDDSMDVSTSTMSDESDYDPYNTYTYTETGSEEFENEGEITEDIDYATNSDMESQNLGNSETSEKDESPEAIRSDKKDEL